MQNKETAKRAAADQPQLTATRSFRSAFLLGILLVTFLVAVGSASLAVYQWARRTALTTPQTQSIVPALAVLPSSDTDQPAQAVDVVPLIQPLADAEPAAVAEEQSVAPVDGKTPERITFLLLGVDQRPDDPSPPRTDNIIVLTVEPESGNVGMVSVPRDMFVSLPGFDYSGKINTAYPIGESSKYPGGGGALVKKTVSELIGYPIDYYVKVNFDGFVKIIDLIGGIDVVVPKTITDNEYPTIDYGVETFHIEAGPQHLDGETALKYARTRHADDDFQRAKRQQQVLLAVKDKLVENKLTTTLHLLDLVRLLGDTVEHDIPPMELPGLVSLASKMQIGDINQLVLDTRYAQIVTHDTLGWILVPNRAKIRPAMDTFFAGKPTVDEINVEALAQQQARQEAELARQQVRNDFQSQAETQRRQLADEGARLVVRNGTGNPVLAAQAADWLTREGFNVVSYGQADRSDYPRTVLVEHSDKPVTIESLRTMFAIAADNLQPEADPQSNSDLELIIGSDFYLLVSN
ncbi:MAG: LCP family protein [Anaerolineae bacterium]|nr:LCP family protein [Anaerolineae bacterium]MCB9130992.1 LCP family protein [Anaerolineales bacterium]MCB0230746.1 LCP family protein [Anaerolineae bacterium]MCB0236107.1 LCP family protein [Anaerolineae bacterium]MCB0238425.1 LCP family protein [Anaerolineae bacterium]